MCGIVAVVRNQYDSSYSIAGRATATSSHRHSGDSENKISDFENIRVGLGHIRSMRGWDVTGVHQPIEVELSCIAWVFTMGLLL